MVHILPENPSFSSLIGKSLGAGISKGLSSAIENEISSLREQKENKSLKEKYGVDLSGIKDPETRKLLISQQLKGAESSQNSMLPAMMAIDQMESMLDSEGIGWMGSWNPSGNARFNRGQFESMQAALMPLFKSMFPRGMTEKEFAHVNKHYIPQADDTIETIRGKLQGLKALANSMGVSTPRMDMESLKDQSGSLEMKNESAGKELDATSMKEIINMVGPDKEKVRETARKMGYRVE